MIVMTCCAFLGDYSENGEDIRVVRSDWSSKMEKDLDVLTSLMYVNIYLCAAAEAEAVIPMLVNYKNLSSCEASTSQGSTSY